MTSTVGVGNDVLDLSVVRARRRASRKRLMERVFTTQEREAIAAAVDADLELWSHWAAKEAAFKCVSKQLGAPPTFVHRDFAVEWTALSDAPDSEAPHTVRDGTVRWRGPQGDLAGSAHAFHVVVDLHGDALHAIAVSGGPGGRAATVRGEVARLESPEADWAGDLDELLSRLTPREADAVHSRESAAVRIAARAALARALGVHPTGVEIVCPPGDAGRRPPYVLVDGEPGRADVSLSHHGAWIGWALWYP